MNVIPRRRFLAYWVSASATVVFPSLLGGCQQLSPQPFETGRKVRPPKGCEDLRATNPNGDC